MGIIEACSRSIWPRWIALAILVAAGCGDDAPSKPSVTGTPPPYLAGVWALEDSVAACEVFSPVWPLSHSTDTITPGGPDFTFENAWSVWRKYTDLFRIEHDLVLTSCSGTISETLIDVTCRGKGEYFNDYTGEICHYLLRIRTAGRPDAEKWRLNRSITWSYLGKPCGSADDDTFDVCQVYITDLTRIGDLPDSLGILSDNSVGHP